MSARSRIFPSKITPNETVAKQFRAIFARFGHVVSPIAFRKWKSLSLRQMVGVLEMFDCRAARESIWHWEHGRLIPDRVRKGYAAALKWRVGIESDQRLVAILDKKWRLIIRRRCDTCGETFKPKRVNQRFCSVGCRR